MLLQVVIIFVGKSAFHVVNEGFTGEQWGICIGFSAITFVVSFFVKLIPIHNWIEKILESKSKDNDEEHEIEETKKEEKDDIKEIDLINEKDDKIKIKMRNEVKPIKEENNIDVLRMSENGGRNTSHALNSQVSTKKKYNKKKY